MLHHTLAVYPYAVNMRRHALKAKPAIRIVDGDEICTRSAHKVRASVRCQHDPVTGEVVDVQLGLDVPMNAKVGPVEMGFRVADRSTMSATLAPRTARNLLLPDGTRGRAKRSMDVQGLWSGSRWRASAP